MTHKLFKALALSTLLLTADLSLAASPEAPEAAGVPSATQLQAPNDSQPTAADSRSFRDVVFFNAFTGTNPSDVAKNRIVSHCESYKLGDKKHENERNYILSQSHRKCLLSLACCTELVTSAESAYIAEKLHELTSTEGESGNKILEIGDVNDRFTTAVFEISLNKSPKTVEFLGLYNKTSKEFKATRAQLFYSKDDFDKRVPTSRFLTGSPILYKNPPAKTDASTPGANVKSPAPDASAE